MKVVTVSALALALSTAAFADFSYTSTSKVTGGSIGAMAGTAANRTTKFYLKGQKMVSSSSDLTTIIDFGAQTVTTINAAQKSYTVRKFSDVGAAMPNNVDITVNVKETGQKKNVNGFDASEMIITMDMDMEMGRGPAMKMQMEMDTWISSDVPGAAELRDFYKKNMANFPWSALTGSENAGMQKAMAQMQRKMAELNGVTVEQIIRVKPSGGAAQMPAMPNMTPAQQAQMQAAMAQMQQMSKQGGPGAAAAQQAMAAMGGMGRGAAAGGSSGALMEMTSDSGGFSSASVPDSVFSIPEGYKQAQ